jgi:ArsR family transcriptional regulator
MPIPTTEELDLLHSNICQAVGDPKRIQILYALHEQPMNVSALAEALETPQPTISRHLAILRERSLVVAERSGASVIYHVAQPRMIEVLDTMRAILRDVFAQRANAVIE